MEFTDFNRIVDSMLRSSSSLDKTHEIGIDLLEFVEDYNTTIHLLLNEVLTTEGLDWFDWFMYEKNYIQDGIGNPELKAFSKDDSDESIEIIKDLNGLYEYLTENKYFKCVSQK